MRVFLILILASISIAAGAQQDLHIARYYGYPDGLNNFIVDCMEQDSRGFLWIGTKEGVNRFDGYQFKKYYSEKNNPNSLSHNKVLDMLEYRPGYLLFTTSSGLSVLNTYTGAFENETIRFAQLAPGSGTVVSSLFQDPDQNIWVNHSGEIDVFDKDMNYLYRFTDLAWTKSLKGIISRYEKWHMDRHGRLWLPTEESGMHIVDLPNQEIFNYNHNPDKLPYLRNGSVRSFLLNETDQILWLGAWGEGLLRCDLSSGNVTQEYFNLKERDENRTINALLQTEYGTILFTINGNCYEMDPHTMAYRQVLMAERVQVKAGNAPMGSVTMLCSTDGRYWIGGTGLYLLEDSKDRTDLVVIDKNQYKSCSDLIVAGDGMLYSLHDHGLLVSVDEASHEVKHYHIPGQERASLTKLCEDRSGRIWIGTPHGVQIFDPGNGTFREPSFLPDEPGKAHINVLFMDSRDNMWIGTRNPFHLYCYKETTGQTQRIPPEFTRQFREISTSGRISIIAEDRRQRLWMTSIIGGGILCYDMEADQWKTYPSGTENYNFLVSKGITSMLPDQDAQTLWLSTFFGDGLVAYHIENDSIVHYTREQGLLSDYIQTINADRQNNLWLSSEFGVTRFNTSAGKAESNIVFESGRFVFQSFESAFHSPSDQLVLGIHDVYIFISTPGDTGATILPQPVLDRMCINNQQLYADLDDAQLRFQHTQKNIAIDFTAVDYTNADKLRFAYRLDGADTEWQYTGMNRTAQYASLSPGRYTFNLKVADENGNWGPEYQMLSFAIVPPFWRTPWFILCALGVVVLVITWMVRRRIHMIRYEAELKQKVAETEMMALRAQMNPHFIFNCINSIDYLIQRNDKYHATVYLNKFAKLIRSILDSSRQNVVTLAKDIETLKLYIELEQFRNDNKFVSNIDADPALLHGDFKVPPLIIQPYVENAILHGLRNRADGGGQLSVSLNRVNGHIQYVIEDNGVGRNHTRQDHAADKVSYGMQMSSERVKLFNQEEFASVYITDLGDNGVATGTRVEVLLKMS